MANFKKYNSIENSYQNVFIERFCTIYPELKDEVYTVTEKLDGTNSSFIFGVDGSMTWASRERILTHDSKLCGVSLEHIYNDAEMNSFFDFIANKAVNENKEYQIYGEIFSDSINRRVKYGKEPKFRIFDMRIEDFIISQYDLSNLVPSNLMVPFICLAQGLEEALNVPIEFNSKILNIENNICEGVVIKPLNKVYYSPVGSIFYLKNKNKKFMEREKIKKEHAPISDDVKAWHDIFKGYINENRVISVMSKFGEIESPKQFGEYIKYVLNDAKDDFKKENPEYEFSPDSDKFVFNVGSYIVEFLKRRV